MQYAGLSAVHSEQRSGELEDLLDVEREWATRLVVT